MKKLRALVLVHATLVPPESLRGVPEKEIDEWRTEYDVISHLKAAGHEVMPLGVDDNLMDLRRAILEWKPDIVFNLLEEFDGIVTYDQHIVAFLELMHQPYTGCNPRGMLLSRDKVLSKQLLSYHRVPTPQFVVFPRGRTPRLPKRLRFPMFVKSSTDDASLGIAHASVVADGKQLAERIDFIHEQSHSDALVEEWLDQGLGSSFAKRDARLRAGPRRLGSSVLRPRARAASRAFAQARAFSRAPFVKRHAAPELHRLPAAG